MRSHAASTADMRSVCFCMGLGGMITASGRGAADGVFVTGATGFIGRHLVERLLARGERVHALVRPESLDKFEALKDFWGPRSSRVAAVAGDLTRPNLGVSKADLR